MHGGRGSAWVRAGRGRRCRVAGRGRLRDEDGEASIASSTCSRDQSMMRPGRLRLCQAAMSWSAWWLSFAQAYKPRPLRSECGRVELGHGLGLQGPSGRGLRLRGNRLFLRGRRAGVVSYGTEDP